MRKNSALSGILLPGSLVCMLLISGFFIDVPPAFSLTVPERLEFDLMWGNIKAGTASLEIRDEEDQIRISSRADSVKWVSFFYKVEDRVEARLEKGKRPVFIGSPLSYRVKLREGRHQRDKEVIFDHMTLKATYTDNLKGKKKTIDFAANAFDPLSSFYYLRTMDFEVGKSVYLDIFDSKKMWNVEVQILRKEKITTRLGEFDTIVVKPLMKSEGIFSRRGDTYIWLTDDQRHIPVQLKIKVVVGYVHAVLTGGDY